MEQQIRSIISSMVLLVELSGAGIASLAIGRAMVQYVRKFLWPASWGNTPSIRMRLGQSLILAVEFMVAADILRTALTPTWNDLGRLAALIGLRTLLSLTLIHELDLIGEQLDMH